MDKPQKQVNEVPDISKLIGEGGIDLPEKVEDDPRLPDKSLFRIDEVADYFGVTDRCIRLWLENKHLESEKIVGSIRITRESILKCRFRKVMAQPTL